MGLVPKKDKLRYNWSRFLKAGCSYCRPVCSIKALKGCYAMLFVDTEC